MTKKALIATRENVFDPNNNELLGHRVAQVVEVGQEFEVDPNLQWVDCEDNVVPDEFYYSNGSIAAVPEYIPPPKTWEDNQREAIRKLAKDNVRNYQSLLDADESSLLNKAAIVAYYNQLVDVKNNPVDGDIEWLAWEEPNWA